MTEEEYYSVGGWTSLDEPREDFSQGLEEQTESPSSDSGLEVMEEIEEPATETEISEDGLSEEQELETASEEAGTDLESPVPSDIESMEVVPEPEPDPTPEEETQVFENFMDGLFARLDSWFPAAVSAETPATDVPVVEDAPLSETEPAAVEPEEPVLDLEVLDETGEETEDLPEVLSWEDVSLQLLTEIHDVTVHPLLTTNFADYTVLEGLLLLLVLWLAIINPCIRMLKGGFSWLLW